LRASTPGWPAGKRARKYGDLLPSAFQVNFRGSQATTDAGVSIVSADAKAINAVRRTKGFMAG